MTRFMMMVAAAIVLSAMIAEPAWAARKGRLDGQVYEVESLKDQLTFTEGKFYTRKSADAGYEPANYQAAPWAGGVGFRARLRNSAGRRMQWQGLIKGDTLDGEILADVEQGGPRTKTPFIAKLKPDATPKAPAAKPAKKGMACCGQGH